MSTLHSNASRASIHKIAVCRREAASLLDISASTFDEWIRRGWMPTGIKIGALRRWDMSEVMACWQELIEQNKQGEEDDGENPFDSTVG